MSDQTSIIVGDCVAVEESGSTANIRRMSPTACAADATQAVKSLESDFQRDAAACAAAKDQLVNAPSESDVELAKRKISILCND